MNTPTTEKIEEWYLNWDQSGNPEDFCYPRVACGILLMRLRETEAELEKLKQSIT